MRIAIVGLHNEASTFSAHRADASFFAQTRGAELVAHYRMEERLGADAIAGVEWVPVLRATAGASGPVLVETYDAFEREIVDGLASAVAEAPLDGVYLDIHGAVAVEGRDDAEERFVGAIREVVGPDAVLSASMDTHGNISSRLAGLLDLIAVHRHAPHIDLLDTRDRAIRLLIEVLRDGRRPALVHVRVPLLLSGEFTSTAVEPGRSVFAALEPAIARHGVLDAGMVVGFAWADEPRCAAAVVVSGWDADAARACAAELAAGLWRAHEDFAIVSEHSGSWGDALDFVASGAARPVWVSDSGDNVTAGGSGDLTVALTETLARVDAGELGDTRFLFGAVTDAAALAAAASAGVGAVRTLDIGATIDTRFTPPVRRAWTVERFVGPDESPVAAVLRSEGPSHGSVSVVVEAERSPFAAVDDPGFPPGVLAHPAFVEPDGYDVVVVKNGYLFPSQVARAASSFMAITPGGTDLDPERLSYERLERPIFPLDTGFEPDLTPQLLHECAALPVRK